MLSNSRGAGVWMLMRNTDLLQVRMQQSCSVVLSLGERSCGVAGMYAYTCACTCKCKLQLQCVCMPPWTSSNTSRHVRMRAARRVKEMRLQRPGTGRHKECVVQRLTCPPPPRPTTPATKHPLRRNHGENLCRRSQQSIAQG